MATRSLYRPSRSCFWVSELTEPGRIRLPTRVPFRDSRRQCFRRESQSHSKRLFSTTPGPLPARSKPTPQVDRKPLPELPVAPGEQLVDLRLRAWRDVDALEFS